MFVRIEEINHVQNIFNSFYINHLHKIFKVPPKGLEPLPDRLRVCYATITPERYGGLGQVLPLLSFCADFRSG